VNQAGTFQEKLSSYLPEDRRRISGFAETAAENRLGTASILLDLNLDADAVIAALLPAGSRTEETAARLAKEAARLAAVPAQVKNEQEAEKVRKALFALASGIRPILIRLASVLHAMRTLDSLPEEQRRPAAQECLDVFAPLADRLGISWIKTELEDLALKQLNREMYLQIKEIVAHKRGERSAFLDSVKAVISRETAAAGIAVELQSRAKHFYSIYQKMRRRNVAPGDLYDLFAIRILCPGVDACYALLGMIHRLWKPIDGRFRDYIASPKPNGYQSLHTAVLADGNLLEIQIRTFSMHHTAEYGVAGHWMYKHKSEGSDGMALVNRMKNWSKGGDGFFEELREEILKNRVYVFTPRGKVLELPKGATPLDFAYAVHSAVGERCMAAKADGVIIPLDRELNNAQVVEIVTSAAARPGRNWLNIVKTAKARNKIRTWLTRDETGKAAPKPPPKAEPVPKEKQKEITGEEETERFVPGPKNAPAFKVRVSDEKNMLVRFAKCCNPLSGDPITGYVSRGRGIVIHRSNCRNLALIPDFAERSLPARWEDAGVPVRRFRIEAREKTDIHARADGGLFSEIEGAVRKFRGRLIEGKLEQKAARHVTGLFTIQLESPQDAAKIIKHIRGIPAVYSIQTLP
jgi:GTP pyrophosphokinase